MWHYAEDGLQSACLVACTLPTPALLALAAGTLQAVGRRACQRPCPSRCRFCCRQVGNQREGTGQPSGSGREVADRAQIARASCGHAVARRSGRGTRSVSEEQPCRRFWTRACPRVKASAEAERAAGYYSELRGALTGPSTCAGRDFRIALVDRTATVHFCRAMASDAGRDARIRAQIEATLRQLPTVEAVRLLGRDGRCLFDRSGRDGCPAARVASGTASELRAGAR